MLVRRFAEGYGKLMIGPAGMIFERISVGADQLYRCNGKLGESILEVFQSWLMNGWIIDEVNVGLAS